MIDAPSLSVVVVTDSLSAIADVLEAWRAQTIRERVELVVVAPRGALQSSAGAFEGFAGVNVVEVPALVSAGAALANGVRAASAPLVYLAETHAFPDRGVAEALVACHGEGSTAVVPALVNANPGVLSSSGFLFDYGRWAEGERRELERVPSHNVAVDRDVLIAYGDRLPAMLELGSGLGEDLRGSGLRLHFEPAARVRHLNVAKTVGFAAERFLAGRVVAAARSARWSFPRRLLYAGGMPLVPGVLLIRILREPLLRSQLRQLPVAARLALGGAWLLAATGEAVGYLAGVGSAFERLLPYEIHRVRYL